jgi:hypothetical protein
LHESLTLDELTGNQVAPVEETSGADQQKEPLNSDDDAHPTGP